jgi:hypothetical protein
MGLSGHHHHHHRDAYEAVYGGRRPHHEITHEFLAAAVGFEAMRMYEHHREREGIPVHHRLAKELLAAFVAAEIDRHFDTGRIPARVSGEDRSHDRGPIVPNRQRRQIS